MIYRVKNTKVRICDRCVGHLNDNSIVIGEVLYKKPYYEKNCIICKNKNVINFVRLKFALLSHYDDYTHISGILE